MSRRIINYKQLLGEKKGNEDKRRDELFDVYDKKRVLETEIALARLDVSLLEIITSAQDMYDKLLEVLSVDLTKEEDIRKLSECREGYLYNYNSNIRDEVEEIWDYLSIIGNETAYLLRLERSSKLL